MPLKNPLARSDTLLYYQVSRLRSREFTQIAVVWLLILPPIVLDYILSFFSTLSHIIFPPLTDLHSHSHTQSIVLAFNRNCTPDYCEPTDILSPTPEQGPTHSQSMAYSIQFTQLFYRTQWPAITRCLFQEDSLTITSPDCGAEGDKSIVLQFVQSF